jgi:hypothetical protein
VRDALRRAVEQLDLQIRDPTALGAVLRILLRVVYARLRQRTSCARGRLGAVTILCSALPSRRTLSLTYRR